MFSVASAVIPLARAPSGGMGLAPPGACPCGVPRKGLLRPARQETLGRVNPPPHTTPRETSALGIAQPPLAGGLAHACFLERLSEGPEGDEGDRQTALGAFLVMRVVDKLGPQAGELNTEAFSYQLRATKRHLAEEAEDSAERAHLDAIVRAVHAAWQRQRPSLLAPSLLAYAHWLEEQLRYHEALDALWTLLLVGGERLSVADRVAGTLFVARINRKLARFDQAEAHYRAGGALAATAGDFHSALLSRVGLGLVLSARGNLPAAEAEFRSAFAEAGRHGIRDAQARAAHSLGNVLVLRGQPIDGVGQLLASCRLYEDREHQLRALSDVGIVLRSLGAYGEAREAFTIVAAGAVALEVRMNAVVELMEIASRLQDRLSFERHREAVAECEERLAMADRVDYLLKWGLGFARFGQSRRAEELLGRALKLAGENGLHEQEFRIARIRAGLPACAEELAASSAPGERPSIPGLENVAASLEELAGAGQGLD